MILVANEWKEYELIDAGEGEKLERWGNFILRRPDPQALWDKNKAIADQWEKADLFYHRNTQGGGFWEKNSSKVPESWTLNYKNLKFQIKPTAFKHTGLFPEQASNWERLISKIKNEKLKIKREIKVLNLFAYTGAATVACASAGAEVTHIDSSKGMTLLAKENLKLSGLENSYNRFIVEDVIKFVQREVRRGSKYEGIIMDPPVYGRGANGQLWEIEKDLVNLVRMCRDILSDNPLFFLVNAYANDFSHLALENMLRLELESTKLKNIESGELALPLTSRDLLLPAGLYAYASS